MVFFCFVFFYFLFALVVEVIFPSAKTLFILSNAKHACAVTAGTPSLAPLEVKAGPYVKTNQWNPRALIAMLSCLVNTAGHIATPLAAGLGCADFPPAQASSGVSALLAPSPQPGSQGGFVSLRAAGRGPTMLSLYCVYCSYCSASLHSGLLKALC